MSKITRPPKRLTIVIDSEIDSKLREIHGQLIAADSKNYSFSRVVNLMLLAGIMSAERLDHQQWHMIKSALEHKKIRFEEFISSEYIAKIAEASELV
jgi:hypothetical protein